MAMKNPRNFTKISVYIFLIGITLGYILGYIFLDNFIMKQKNKQVLFINRFDPNDLNKTDKNLILKNPYFEETINNEVQKVRILCWVLTHPKNHKTKAVHVKATWGKRCDVLLFMSSKGDLYLPAVELPGDEGRGYLWGKTKNAFQHIHNHYIDTADWFLKADDDTYVIIENLKYLLVNQNSSEALYFGWRFKHYVKQGFMSGGAGYVLSKAALNKFVLEALPNSSKCQSTDDGDEDTEMGKCMENVGVRAVNTRDSLGRERFFPLVPDSLLVPGHTDPDSWYYAFSFFPPQEGRQCCSDAAISFHYVIPEMMYVIEHMVYHLRPYGIDKEVSSVIEDERL